MISLEKLQILSPLQKLPKNVGDLGELIVFKALKTCTQSNKSPNLVTLAVSQLRRRGVMSGIFCRQSSCGKVHTLSQCDQICQNLDTGDFLSLWRFFKSLAIFIRYLQPRSHEGVFYEVSCCVRSFQHINELAQLL